MERRPGEDAETAALAQVLPVVENGTQALVERHSDVTLLFHLKTETKPFERSTLSEYVGVTPGPDEDWRWSIVEAKGIRPAGARVGPESLTEPLLGVGGTTGEKAPVVPATNAPANIPPQLTREFRSERFSELAPELSGDEEGRALSAVAPIVLKQGR